MILLKEFYSNSNPINVNKTIVINMEKDKERLDYIKKQCQNMILDLSRRNGKATGKKKNLLKQNATPQRKNIIY